MKKNISVEEAEKIIVNQSSRMGKVTTPKNQKASAKKATKKKVSKK